jgi:hypothetical protein
MISAVLLEQQPESPATKMALQLVQHHVSSMTVPSWQATCVGGAHISLDVRFGLENGPHLLGSGSLLQKGDARSEVRARCGVRQVMREHLSQQRSVVGAEVQVVRSHPLDGSVLALLREAHRQEAPAA